MKTLITLFLLSSALMACGNSNLNTESVLGLPGSGVTQDGRCDSKMIANRALLNRDSAAGDYVQLEKDCKSFVKKYPSSECRALDVDAGNKEIKLKTTDLKESCKEILNLHKTAPATDTSPAVTTNPPVVQKPAPAPVTPPVSTPPTPTQPVDAGTCTEDFIKSYSQIGQDLGAVTAASQDQAALVKAGEKLNADCKAFIAAYPATSCKAQNPDKTIATVDSREIQPVCKKFADYMNSLNPGKPTPKSTDLNTVVQSIEL